MSLTTVEVERIEWIKGLAYPAGVHYREIIVTGPPCSGKTTLVQQLGGWPEEGLIDLARDNWWHSRILTFRPREVHFAVPFRGFSESCTVFDRAWLAAPSAVDYGRIRIPPGRGWFLQLDWRKRFLFDFQLPGAAGICSILEDRARRESHPLDDALASQDVERQMTVYETLAQHFQRCGLRVIVRTEFLGMPRAIVEADAV